MQSSSANSDKCTYMVISVLAGYTIGKMTHMQGPLDSKYGKIKSIEFRAEVHIFFIYMHIFRW